MFCYINSHWKNKFACSCVHKRTLLLDISIRIAVGHSSLMRWMLILLNVIFSTSRRQSAAHRGSPPAPRSSHTHFATGRLLDHNNNNNNSEEEEECTSFNGCSCSLGVWSRCHSSQVSTALSCQLAACRLP